MKVVFVSCTEPRLLKTPAKLSTAGAEVGTGDMGDAEEDNGVASGGEISNVGGGGMTGGGGMKGGDGGAGGEKGAGVGGAAGGGGGPATGVNWTAVVC